MGNLGSYFDKLNANGFSDKQCRINNRHARQSGCSQVRARFMWVELRIICAAYLPATRLV